MADHFEPVPYNPAPPAPSGQVDVNGSGAQPFRVEANPNDFGAQVGGALEKSGEQLQETGAKAMDFATEAATIATETKANDVYAKGFAPAAAALRSQFDQLDPIDKFHAYDDYVGKLQSTSDQYIGSINSPLGQKMVSGLVTRHITAEIDGARREADQGLVQGQGQSYGDVIMAGTGQAVNNYNNPQVVDQISQQNASMRQIQGMNDRVPQPVIDQNIRNDQNTLAQGLINWPYKLGTQIPRNNCEQNILLFCRFLLSFKWTMLFIARR